MLKHLFAASLLAFAVTSHAQEHAPAAAAAPLPDQIAKHKQIYLNMGFPEDEATMMAVLTGGKINSEAMLMLMMGMAGRGGGDDALGFMMLMNGIRQANKGQPPWWRDGEFVFIVEDGVLVKINTETMEVAARLPYRDESELEAVSLGLLAKMFMFRAQAQDLRGEAQVQSCVSNMKQLMLGVLMYTQDFDQTLPGATWAKDLLPYVGNNEQLLRCPGRPDVPVGYALNEKLVGARLGDIKLPSETVALFEVRGGGESQVGNAADVPDPGFHNGMLAVGFMDGHVEMMSSLELRRALERNPFE
ncbi:MAG: hypothetical protein HPY44_14155 [Armatimonadetes bacterium]|nr:hypothetical protein [Armatimonadota bacterium]